MYFISNFELDEMIEMIKIDFENTKYNLYTYIESTMNPQYTTIYNLVSG